MGKVFVENILVYAYHGCLPEETIIGSEYLVDVWVEGDLSESSKTDALKHTIDYVAISACVKEEMAVPSKLLEVVVSRILDRIFSISQRVDVANVKVTKVNPPINAHVGRVAVELQRHKNS